MNGLAVRATIDAHLTWDYDERSARLRALYEHAKQAQWNATTAVDWSTDVAFGAPLPEESAYALAAFDASPLARYGRPMWDTFRWEFQSWMVSQFLHGEQGALVATARLVEVLADVDAKSYAASQVSDEARHVEVFARYLREHVPQPYAISPPLAALVNSVLADSRWDMTALGMQLIIEPLAMAAFRLANTTFHDPLITAITALVARDEARHVAFGIQLLQGAYRGVTASERAEREAFVLEAARLMSRRFLLEDVWERIGIDREAGIAFAATNPLMVGYRQAIFAKVVAALVRIGLMTPRVRAGFSALNLLGAAGSHAVRELA